MWSRFAPVHTHPTGKTMSLDRSRLLLTLYKPTSRSRARAFFTNYSLVLEDDGASPTPLAIRKMVNHTPRRFWVKSGNGKVIPDSTLETLFSDQSSDLASVGAVYTYRNDLGQSEFIAPLPDVLLLRFANGSSVEQMVPLTNVDRTEARLATPPDDVSRTFVEAFAARGLRVAGELSSLLSPFQYVVLTNALRLDAAHAKNEFLGQFPTFVESADFKFQRMEPASTATPRDPLYSKQWNMDQSGGGGIGAGGPGVNTGWDMAPKLGQGVRVCIIDTGIALAHPDFDLTRFPVGLRYTHPDHGVPASQAGEVLNLGEAPHGTACAGIIAAKHNNDTGVAGLACNADIMSAAVNSVQPDEVAAAINWAIANNARILSMSFGSKESDLWASEKTLIGNAIAAAFNAGIIICASSGNQVIPPNHDLLYPAKLADKVIACGASNQEHRRCTATDWGASYESNYGPGISVVAPGKSIPTTDLIGKEGWNDKGDYYECFWGTSAAAPHVAGLAALILGQYPTLTQSEVRQAIEATAEKINDQTKGGTYTYHPPSQQYPYGTWNDEVGYGRINVTAALAFAAGLAT